MPSILEMVERMCAEVRGEIQGPPTLHTMSRAYWEYVRCIKLAEHNRSGRNPRYPGNAGKVVGDKLQARADKLATEFPAFPEALAREES